MSELKKPNRPWAPSSYEYQERVERRYIYRFTETLLPEDSYDDESREVETPKKDIGEVDLDWLLTQIPEGVDPSQIKLEFGYNTSSMAYEDHYIRFYYNETIPKRTKEYNAAKKKHEEALVKYEQDLKEYEAALKVKERQDIEQRIRECEEKLAQLMEADK